ncbi:GNAT family N-acetyltransferase [Salmonella enterica]|nr:GNAT family N-acetyltransferase [Salmonella enterica]
MPDKCFPHFQSDTDTVIPVSVVRGMPPGQCRAALHLFWNAFSRKLRFTLGTEKKALRFLERCIDPKQTVCAIDSAGQLAGFAAIKSSQCAFINPTLSTFFNEYGIPAGFVRALIMNQLDYKPAVNELMIESICVNECYRGMGIGQILLSYIKYLAVLQDKNLTLDVIAENSGARRLYERTGFYEIGRKKLFFSAPLFGFRHVIRMQFSPHSPDSGSMMRQS